VTRRAAALLALLALVVVVVAACGITEDGDPRQISREDLPPELIDPAATGTTLGGTDGAARQTTLFLVRAGTTDTEALVPVSAEIPRTSAAELPQAVTEALIAARPDQLGRSDLVNAVPPDAQVRSATVGDDHVLDLDLTNLGKVQSSLQRLAVAQLVFTLTELRTPRIDAVRFSVDGEEVGVPIENGVAAPGQPVSRADEPSLTITDATTGG
jgi:spore germination protein GerM